jgi:pimeloyl-ACP methyl ester carboxylesterase
MVVFLLLVFGSTGAGTVFAQTSSPFPPPQEKWGLYVVNSGQGLDTGCTFRDDGPLLIKVVVPATMNSKELNSDGTLKNPGKLIANGVVGATAKIDFPVYDIDSDDPYAAYYGYAPEYDEIRFNGELMKTLKGIDNTWTNDSIMIPIGKVKFKSDVSPNAVNEFRVDIDQQNSVENWCMAVDWVSVEFDAAAPYVLMHGINSDESTWDESDAPGVIKALDDKGVLWTRFSTGKNELSNANARDLEGKIKAFLQPAKGDKINIIAHSKGGLDAQALAASAPPFKILSLATLSTPHYGSVAADLSIIQKTKADDRTNSGNDPNGYASAYVDTWTFGQGPQLPGLRDLTTSTASTAINNGLRGTVKPTYSFGADADLDSDGDLESSESKGLFPGIAHYAAERTWRVLRDFSSASIVKTEDRFIWLPVPMTVKVLTYQANPGGPYPNDIVVTTKSANPSYATPLGNVKANHSTMKTGARIEKVLPLTLPLR